MKRPVKRATYGDVYWVQQHYYWRYRAGRWRAVSLSTDNPRLRAYIVNGAAVYYVKSPYTWRYIMRLDQLPSEMVANMWEWILSHQEE